MTEETREFVKGVARVTKHRPNGGYHDLSGKGVLELNEHFVRNTRRFERVNKLSKLINADLGTGEIAQRFGDKFGPHLRDIIRDYAGVERIGSKASVYLDGTPYDQIVFDVLAWSLRCIVCYPVPTGLLFSLNVERGAFRQHPSAHWEKSCEVDGCYFIFVPDASNKLEYHSHATGYADESFPWLDVVRSAIWAVDDHKLEYPVAASILVGDDIVTADRPLRHHDVIATQEYQDLKKNVGDGNVVQGFTSNHGNFLSRKRAMYLAATHKLPLKRENNEPFLLLGKMSSSDANGQRHVGHGGNMFTHDRSSADYAISSTSLFSEDLW